MSPITKSGKIIGNIYETDIKTSIYDVVIPTYNIILAPDATLYYPIDQLRRCSGGNGIAVGERMILIVAKENRKTRQSVKWLKCMA